MSDFSVAQQFAAYALAGAPIVPSPHLEVCGDGAPVVLLHGWGASIRLFTPITSVLRAHFRVIAPDFPGFGMTAPPPQGWAVHDFADWVLAILDALQVDRAHVIGHSFGGRVAISIAARFPQRVDRLVLTGSAGIKPQRTLRYHVRVRWFKVLRQLAMVPLLPAPLRAAVQRQVQRLGSSDYQQAAGTVRASFVRVVNEDLRLYLPKIRAATLLVWGDEDADTPLADGQVMEQLIPDAGLVVFAGAGHYAYLEQSARFCRIVETFFSQVP